MALEMTATIYADNEQGLAEALANMRRLVKRGCIYDNQKEDGVTYAFGVSPAPTLMLDPKKGLVLDYD